MDVSVVRNMNDACRGEDGRQCGNLAALQALIDQVHIQTYRNYAVKKRVNVPVSHPFVAKEGLVSVLHKAESHIHAKHTRARARARA